MEGLNTLYEMALEELPTEEQALQGTGLGANSQDDADSEDGGGSDGGGSDGGGSDGGGSDGGGSDSESSNNEGGITLQTIRDGVVGDSTRETYYGDIINFLKWTAEHHRDWLTARGRQLIPHIFLERPNEGIRDRSKRIRRQFIALLRQAETHPLLNVAAVTPDGYMEYLVGLRHPRHGGLLGKSAYGNKRSSLFHLFRLHNKRGFPEEFRLQLGNLFKGFFRQLPRQGRNRSTVTPSGQPSSSILSVKEGKDAMSVELYNRICEWFLTWGTLAGVFSHCFLVLSWNLACRSNNTAYIHLADISWATLFDTFDIYFAHMKTDQTGTDSKYPRHLYANPTNPLVCPVFALGLYFSTSFNAPVDLGSPLFPGSDQHSRFGDLLQKVLGEHEEELQAMGFKKQDIGTHSIRKGAVSYLASLVGGPPAASTCIRAGWTMGKVRDIYMRYVASGDQFVGRSLSLLPIMGIKFGASPPFFVPAWEEWGDGIAQAQMPMVAVVPHFRRVTLMCTASLLYHRQFVLASLPDNHVIRSSYVFRNAQVLSTVGENQDIVTVTYPWDDTTHTFSGIPPHTVLLQEMERMRIQQQNLADTFEEKVRTAIDEAGLSGTGVTERRLTNMFDGFARELREQLSGLGVDGTRTSQQRERVETGTGYEWHYYDGKIHRVPKDWRFPRVGVLDCWRQWWIGDSVRNVPPLRNLKAADLAHLDSIPLSPEEMHGRSGRHRTKRRPARKIYSDMAFLMNYITDKVVANGMMPEEITISSVDAMYLGVAEEFGGGQRNAQKKWNTLVKELRIKQRQG